MDQIRKAIAYVGAQLSRLTVTQRLLIASLAVVMVMTLFLVSQYAATPAMVELATGTPEDQDRMAQTLDKERIPYERAASGRIMVAPERRYSALAQLARERSLPNDKRLMFNTLAAQSNWMMPSKQLDQMYTTALTNELSAVIRNFPGIEDAAVFVSAPEPGGLGAAARKPVAQVTLFPKSGTALDQGTVNALADLVSGAVAGLDARDVAVIDGTSKRSFRAASGEDAFAGTYMEQVARVERRVQDKVLEHLRYIGDVIVSVNAIVDGAQRKTVESRFLNKGEGSVALLSEEATQTNTSTSNSKGGAEPGLAANVGMDITRSSSTTGSNTNDETTTNKYATGLGERSTTQVDARGRPTKINLTVSVPRDYVVLVAKQKKAKGGAPATDAGGKAAEAEPTEEEIRSAWDGPDGVKSVIEATVGPLVETDGVAGGQFTAGTVKAFLIPVAMVGGAAAHMGGSRMNEGSGGSGAGGALRGIGGLLGTGLAKTIAVGSLAVLAVGLMFFMVRKATRPTPLPTADELVGIPPALPGSDVVGEADETETAMVGIEIDPDRLKTGKMLEEVTQLVKSNPSAAASVFGRWMASDD